MPSSCSIRLPIDALSGYAEHIHEKYVEHQDALDKQRLIEIATNPELRNGVFQADSAEVLEKIANREHPAPRPVSMTGPSRPASSLPRRLRQRSSRNHAVTLADPMAILGQFLAVFSNMCGRTPNWRY